jgi:signal transduction histidine kinase
MSVVLAYRFATAMRRVEEFNYELRVRVDDATTRLTETLGREHQLALAHSQATARLELVRDLHDGFGGSLVSTIAALEHGASRADAGTQVVERLKALRDDLRLVIETTTRTGAILMDDLETLRHRWSDRFDAAGMLSDWCIEGLEDTRLSATRNLELLRFLQEALTNVLKHSRARRVQIELRRAGERLYVAIADDGCGFDRFHPPGGMGLGNLQARARHLGAELVTDTSPGVGTRLRMDAPI